MAEYDEAAQVRDAIRGCLRDIDHSIQRLVGVLDRAEGIARGRRGSVQKMQTPAEEPGVRFLE